VEWVKGIGSAPRAWEALPGRPVTGGDTGQTSWPRCGPRIGRRAAPRRAAASRRRRVRDLLLIRPAWSGWRPPPAKYRRLGRVQAHGHTKRAAGGRQPIGFLVRSRAVVLQVKVQRPIGVVGELVAVADGEPVDRVGGLEAFGVVHRHRPERLHRRQLVLGEVQEVVVVAGERPAMAVSDIERVDRILGWVGAQANHGHDGPLEVVVAVHPDRVGVHLPAVDLAGVLS
jgi:hypothetical protein